MLIVLPPFDEVERVLMQALHEDIGEGDITCQSILRDEDEMMLHLVTRESIIISGLAIAGRTFEMVDPRVDFLSHLEDGDKAEAGQILASVSGAAKSLLSAERTALNLLQRMCGIATETNRYVQAVAHTGCRILDTRKTAPGLRALDKYAVRCGGGQNHRMRLDDAVLIKDNHIACVGNVSEAVMRAKADAPANITIEVECDTLTQVEEALCAGADRLLLDNMSLDELREAVTLAKGRARTEASGNMNLMRVAEVAETGVDFISVGKLTHSVRAADIGLDRVDDA